MRACFILFLSCLTGFGQGLFGDPVLDVVLYTATKPVAGGGCSTIGETNLAWNGGYLFSTNVISQKVYNPGTTTPCSVAFGLNGMPNGNNLNVAIHTEANRGGTLLASCGAKLVTISSGNEYVWFDVETPAAISGDYWISIQSDIQGYVSYNWPNSYRAGYTFYVDAVDQTPSSVAFQIKVQ